MITAPVVLGTLIGTIMLYIVDRKLASQVAYYAGLTVMAVTAVLIVVDVALIATRPDMLQASPLSRMINEAVNQGLQEGLKNVPNWQELPALKKFVTPAP
jgi:hypothetical protein